MTSFLPTRPQRLFDLPSIDGLHCSRSFLEVLRKALTPTQETELRGSMQIFESVYIPSGKAYLFAGGTLTTIFTLTEESK